MKIQYRLVSLTLILTFLLCSCQNKTEDTSDILFQYLLSQNQTELSNSLILQERLKRISGLVDLPYEETAEVKYIHKRLSQEDVSKEDTQMMLDNLTQLQEELKQQVPEHHTYVSNRQENFVEPLLEALALEKDVIFMINLSLWQRHLSNLNASNLYFSLQKEVNKDSISYLVGAVKHVYLRPVFSTKKGKIKKVHEGQLAEIKFHKKEIGDTREDLQFQIARISDNGGFFTKEIVLANNQKLSIH